MIHNHTATKEDHHVHLKYKNNMPITFNQRKLVYYTWHLFTQAQKDYFNNEFRYRDKTRLTRDDGNWAVNFVLNSVLSKKMRDLYFNHRSFFYTQVRGTSPYMMRINEKLYKKL